MSPPEEKKTTLDKSNKMYEGLFHALALKIITDEKLKKIVENKKDFVDKRSKQVIENKRRIDDVQAIRTIKSTSLSSLKPTDNTAGRKEIALKKLVQRPSQPSGLSPKKHEGLKNIGFKVGRLRKTKG